MTPIEVAVALSIFLIVLVVIGVRVAFATAFIGTAGLFLIFAVDKAQGFERGLAERGDAVPPDHAVF